MAKLTLYGREMEVFVTMPRIYVKNTEDLEFLAHKSEQVYARIEAGEKPPECSVYKTDGRLEIDLHGAFITGMFDPEPNSGMIVADGVMFRGLWRAAHTKTEVELSADWGVER